MKQKHYIDIENLREEDTELRKNNTGAFEVGDIIQITEKIDGSNFCVAYDEEVDSIVAFSRKQQLSAENNLQGAWNFSQLLDTTPFRNHPSYRVFGEWLVKNKIVYRPECMRSWYIFDIYDAEKEEWLSQDEVKLFCGEAGILYVHVLYEGPFVSWEHCKSFMNDPLYGDKQEGIVVKNQSKLNSPDSRNPFYLKIVNDDFKERMKTKEKVVDPEKEAAKEKATELALSIITKNRIEKELYKMRDEQIIPVDFTMENMKEVAKFLPKRICDDCIKEDKEIVDACGEFFGKLCAQLSMKYAREIIGGENA